MEANPKKKSKIFQDYKMILENKLRHRHNIKYIMRYFIYSYKSFFAFFCIRLFDVDHLPLLCANFIFLCQFLSFC